MIKLVIAGDFSPAGINTTAALRGDSRTLFTDLLPVFEDADYTVINLEVPFIKTETPIEKIGPVLGAPEEAVAGLKAAGINSVNLANNHIMDHGRTGLKNTLEVCRENGIDCFGSGMNLEEARRILLRDIGGTRVAFLGMAEHEFNIAGADRPGANPLDLIDFMRSLKEYRGRFDYLVVLLHGGNEHFPYPRPRLREICRCLIEVGAGAVICQHSHIAGCAENYRGGHIVYGQGNFIFDLGRTDPAWNRGVLVELKIDSGGHSEMDLIPSIQSGGHPGARRMNPKEEEVFWKDFHQRGREIKNGELLEDRWREYCRRQERTLLHLLHGKTSLFSRLVSRLNLRRRSSRKRFRTRLHLFRCESYRETMISILEELSKKDFQD